MGIFNRLRDAISDDSYFYGLAAAEIKSGRRRESMWAKALTQANFEEQAAQAIYMRALVKLLQQENRKVEDVQQAAENHAMQHAVALFDAGKHLEALNGLVLLYDRRADPIAGVCLGYIAWHGVVPNYRDQETGLQFLSKAELSPNVNVRHRLAAVFEGIDWKRALANYDFAAARGDDAAKMRASDLRRILRKKGLLPKTFMDKLLG